MNFWDSSALVRCVHAREPGHVRAANLLRQKIPHGGSAFLALECVAATCRAAANDAVTRRRYVNWLRLQLERFKLVEIDQDLLGRAMRLAERHLLRAADALHLATALSLNVPVRGRRRLVFVTCDAEQARAASFEGLRVLRPDA